MADEGRDRRAEGSTPSYFVKMGGLFFSRDGGSDPLIFGLIVAKKWRQAFFGLSGLVSSRGCKSDGVSEGRKMSSIKPWEVGSVGRSSSVPTPWSDYRAALVWANFGAVT